MILRLVVIGENIFEICLGQCLFEFGFPFGQVVASKLLNLSKVVVTGRNGGGETDSSGGEGGEDSCGAGSYSLRWGIN